MRHTLIGLVGLVVAGGAAAAEPFVVAPVEVQDQKAVFATVESVDLATARTRIGGTIAELAVDEGDAVTAGQLLARVVDPKLPLQERASEAQVAALEAQRQQAIAELERVRQLRSGGTVAAARLDEAVATVGVLDGQIAAAKAQLEVVRQQAREGEVLAPRDGRTLGVHVTLGTVVMPGEPVATIAAERYILRLRLPERHARFLAVGDRVRIGARGLAGEGGGAVGTIRQVYPELDQGRVVADVETDAVGDYFVGERARVEIGTGARTALIVPAGLLRQREGVTYATLEGGREVVVQPGTRMGDGVEILAGLRPGDRLVAPGS